MKSKKSVAVWLVATGGEFAGKVLLQQRASTEMVDGVEKPQAYPFVCQPTWNEKVEGREKLTETIRRGAIEELGKSFGNYYYSPLVSLGAENFSYGGVRFIGLNFIGLITEGQLKLVKLHAGAMPEFIAIGNGDIPNVKVTTDLQREPEKEVVLFPDQWKILRRLFDLKDVLMHLR